jgi:predicted transcriptional regulator YdeE
MSDHGAYPRLAICDGFTVVGTEIRTTNELERDPATAQIGAHWQRFYRDALADKVANRDDAAVTYGVYTDYESDDRGAYAQLVGCEVRGGGQVPLGMRTLAIPGGRYLVFTGTGELPAMVVQTWARVWQYFEGEAREERAYTVDFERYDQRDPSRVEIYIAVK